MLLSKELLIPITKTLPPLTVTTWYWVLDKDINWWVSVATLIYVCLQTFFLLKKNLAKKKQKDENKADQCQD